MTFQKLSGEIYHFSRWSCISLHAINCACENKQLDWTTLPALSFYNFCVRWVLLLKWLYRTAQQVKILWACSQRRESKCYSALFTGNTSEHTLHKQQAGNSSSECSVSRQSANTLCWWRHPQYERSSGYKGSHSHGGQGDVEIAWFIPCAPRQHKALCPCCSTH